ncbi:hypothetical protein [Pseudobacteriovorax antillogorgiicola]|uniref:ABC-type nitrate/sulfonate/bicarbonate transport system, permease component n=1 Tax=Pseudobacteriovorax antillogorgiicola TaxID=1513793 RepID=A0A1Y6CKT8_9BACT|nr:hypothetical protein [Pseudobacteriovorax antillogorgiicola]TCS46122.1 hypothetical protein EDD56_12523 [Pseudobacteriovorax antillogorgiicola]SMF69548.1 hypothetical protein SAMN06296036_12523 [Pseudobacteriovorax antillogorgiicola]
MSPISISLGIIFWIFILGNGFCLAALRLHEGGHSLVLRCVRAVATALQLPSLVLAPIMLMVGFSWLDENLIFPLTLDLPSYELMLYLLPPSFALLCCSGFIATVLSNLEESSKIWLQRSCSLMAQSLGLDPNVQLRGVLFWEISLKTWAQSLPWIFGELLVIECVFNAPGLGYQIWSGGREQNWEQVGVGLGILLMMFLVARLGQRVLGGLIGKRLEQYV